MTFFKYFEKKTIRNFFQKYLVNSGDSNSKLALSIALGVFIGVTPIWGWQLLTTIGLSHLFRLNKFVAVTASNISLPPMLPVVIFVSYVIGGWILGEDVNGFTMKSGISMAWIRENLVQYVVGSLVLGLMLALSLGGASYLVLQRVRKG